MSYRNMQNSLLKKHHDHRYLATPLTEMLLDSVAPEVKTISLGSALIKSATCPRAFSMADSDSHP